MTQTIGLLKSHRSIRKFTDQPIDEAMLKALLEAAQCAATAHFVQAYSIIHVKDQGVRREIAELSGPQAWVEQAPVFLVFCADLNRLELASKMHGKQMKGNNFELFITATVDTALVAQSTMIAAESLGLGGVFIGGIRNDPQKICDLLHIPEHAYPVFGMCLGYPDQDPPVKPRLPVEAVLQTDTYSPDGIDEILHVYDVTTNAYYLTRDTHLKDETWTQQMADFMSEEIRPHMKAFIESKGFCRK